MASAGARGTDERRGCRLMQSESQGSMREFHTARDDVAFQLGDQSVGWPLGAHSESGTGTGCPRERMPFYRSDRCYPCDGDGCDARNEIAVARIDERDVTILVLRVQSVLRPHAPQPRESCSRTFTRVINEMNLRDQADGQPRRRRTS